MTARQPTKPSGTPRFLVQTVLWALAALAIAAVVTGGVVLFNKVDKSYERAILGALDAPLESFVILPDTQGGGPIHPYQRLNYVEPVRERILGVRALVMADIIHNVTCDSEKSVKTYGASFTIAFQERCKQAQALLDAPTTVVPDQTALDALVLTTDNAIITRTGERVCLVIQGQAQPPRLMPLGTFLSHKPACKALIAQASGQQP